MRGEGAAGAARGGEGGGLVEGKCYPIGCFLQLRRADTPSTLPFYTPLNCFSSPTAGCPENPEQQSSLSGTVLLEAKPGGLGMLSCWERFGRRVESFGSAPTPPLAPAPLAPTQP